MIIELREFNKWRRGADIPMPDPKRVGEIIEAVCDAAERAGELEQRVKEQGEIIARLRNRIQEGL